MLKNTNMELKGTGGICYDVIDDHTQHETAIYLFSKAKPLALGKPGI